MEVNDMSIGKVNGVSALNAISTPTHTERKPVETNTSVSANSESFSNIAATASLSQVQAESVSGEEKQEKDNQENHLKSVLSVANQKMKITNTRCEFEYHEKTKRVSIKVIDKKTDEVVREIPPEETLEMIEKMWELAGLIVDERR